MARLATAAARAAAARATPPPAATGRCPAAVRIAGVGVATPPHGVDADTLAGVLHRLWPDRRRHLGRLAHELAGSRRWLVRPPADLGRALTLAEQGARYPELATALAAAAARQALQEAGIAPGTIDLLVVASCTGFVLPGPDCRLVAELGLRDDVVRLPLTQLGCAGGAAGLARAAEWLRGRWPAGRPAAALVVAVELPSLTFQPEDTSDDNLLSALVFGDGAGAAVLVGPAGGGSGPADGQGGPVILRTAERLVPDSAAALGYGLDDFGYRVRLLRDLPERVARALPAAIAALLAPDRADGLPLVALHPGGPRIVDAVQRALGVGPEPLAATRAAFDRAANPSSAGVFFVLDAMDAPPPPRTRPGVLVGLGPGLTLELLELGWGVGPAAGASR